MKFTKILALLISLFVLLTMTTAIVSAEESWEIKDSSFESWGATGSKDSWQTFVQGDGTVDIATAAARTGNYGVNLSGASGRSNIFQNVGPVPVGTSLKITANVKIVSMGSGGVRLIARHGSMDGDLFATTNFITTAGDWQQFSITGTISRTTDLFVEVTTAAGATNYEIYVDDIVVSVYEIIPEVKNGNFDTVNNIENPTAYSNWTNYLGANQTESVVYFDTDRNSNVVKLTHQGYVSQSVTGFKANTTYRVSFDIKSTAAVGMVKLEWTGGGVNQIADINTNGQWGRYYVDAALGSGTTFNINILLRLVGSTGTVYYDNVTVEKVTVTDECIKNGEFEYGVNGETGWTTEGTGTLSADSSAFAGANAIRLSAASGANFSILQSIYPTHTEATIYEYSVYAKLIEAGSDTSSVQLLMENYTPNGSGGWIIVDTPRTSLDHSVMPVGEWTRISMIYPAAATTTRFNIKLRVIGGGTVSFDNASIKPLRSTAIYLAEGSGKYTDKFTSKTMKITANVMPTVTEGSENLTMFAAVYSNNSGVTTLHGISEIQSYEVAAGSYKVFALTVSAPDDFSTKDYYIKIFKWDTTQNAEPQMKSLVVTK